MKLMIIIWTQNVFVIIVHNYMQLLKPAKHSGLSISYERSKKKGILPL